MTVRSAALTIALVAASGGLLAGCGTPAAPPGGSAQVPTTPSASGPQTPCPIAEGDIRTSSGNCLYIDPSLNMQANQFPRSFRPVPSSAAPNANVVAAKVPGILHDIQAHPPVTESSVRAALNAAFPYPPYAAEVSKDAAGANGGIGYGIEVGSACVHGFVSATDQRVMVDGMSEDGGCLPMYGH